MHKRTYSTICCNKIITELKFVTLEIEEDQLEWVSLRIYSIFLYTIGNEILFRVEFENYIRSQSN